MHVHGIFGVITVATVRLSIKGLSMKKTLFAAIISVCLLLPANAVWAKTEKTSTSVTSERMEYDAKRQRVVFTGNVHVTRPDVQIWSDTLTVFLVQKKNSSKNTGVPAGLEGGDIDRIVARDNVRMEHDGKKGKCEKATFTASTGVLEMEGNPVLYDNENTVKGNKILFYTKENRSEIHGGSQPVEAIFSSDSGTFGGKK